MSNTKTVQQIREKMILTYGDLCWMAYKWTPRNQYTFHHIFEARKGGRVKIDNGALLTKEAHCDLNKMDNNYKEYYRDLNVLFTILNDTKNPPKKEYYIELKKILESASKKMHLSEYYNSNMDPIELEELAYISSEKKEIYETFEREVIKPDRIDYSQILDEVRKRKIRKVEPIVFVDETLLHKVKHKTRHKEYYKNKKH